MSENVRESVQAAATSEVDELVGDVLQDIERALSPAPPRMAEPSIPAPRDSEDHLGALAAQLVEEREEERRSLPAMRPPVVSVALDDAWASDDEAPTTEWRRDGSAPPSPESMRALLRYIEAGRELSERETVPPIDEDVTPRPAAVSISTHPAPPRRRFPLSLAVVAMISIGAAIVSYRLGPHSAAGELPPPARAAAAESLALEPLVPVESSPIDYGPPVQTQRLLVSLAPSDARLSIRGMHEPQGEPYAGPWPRAFDLAPGVYELVAFRRRQSIVSRVEIEPGVDPPPLALRIPVVE